MKFFSSLALRENFSYVFMDLGKFPSLLQGYLISMNIPPRKEEGSYVYSLKSEKDHMPVSKVQESIPLLHICLGSW
jgi:hypothetical protein